MVNLVHIGLAKTATTTLQNHVFTRQQRFRYLGKIANGYSDVLMSELVARVMRQDSLAYDAITAQSLLDTLRLHDERCGDLRPLLLSDEGLSGEARADRALIAERLHRLFMPARILIVLRAQPRLLASLYLNWVKSSGERWLPFGDWLAEYYGKPWPERPRIGLDYDGLVRTYEDLFGSDNVVVLPFEWIAQKPTVFARALNELLGMTVDDIEAQLAGSRENIRLSERHQAALAVQNLLPSGTNLALIGRRILPLPLYRRVRDFTTSGRRIAVPELSGEWPARLAALCGEGNTALARRRQLPLATLGYPMGAVSDAEAAE
jgi:hypothetical protein